MFAYSTLIREYPGRIVALDSWLYDTLMLAAAGLVLARAWRVPRERWAWLLIGAGMAIAAVGDVVYAIWVPEGVSPSLADPLYLAFYPLGYAGLLLLVRTALRTVPTAILLDGLVVACTVAAVAAALAFGPIKAAAAGSPATVSVGLAYAAGDVTMLALAVGVLALLGWHTDRRWCLLVAGFIVWAVADTFYLFRTAEGVYLEGTWIDAGWPVAYLLIAVASWCPSATQVPRTKPGLGSFVAPVVCAVFALGVSVFAYGDRLSVLLAAVTLIAVAVRFAVTFRDVSCNGTPPPASDDRRAHRAAQPPGACHCADGGIVRAHARSERPFPVTARAGDVGCRPIRQRSTTPSAVASATNCCAA